MRLADDMLQTLDLLQTDRKTTHPMEHFRVVRHGFKYFWLAEIGILREAKIGVQSNSNGQFRVRMLDCQIVKRYFTLEWNAGFQFIGNIFLWYAYLEKTEGPIKAPQEPKI